MSQDDFTDATRPSPGRMYDYYLGGNHNFEVDRRAAEQVLKLLPFSIQFLRLQRWALQDIAVELTEKRGYDVIIDFASGLPTNNNVHSKVKPGTTVIYSDYDPVIVEYARRILETESNIYIFQADVRRPEELLSRPEVLKILNGRRKVAFVCWGVASYLSDDDIAHSMRAIYDWAAPGSCLAFNAQGADLTPNAARDQVAKIYEQLGTKPYSRSLARFTELLQPWKPEDPGFISLLQWHGFDVSDFAKDEVESFGPMGGGYGAYLTK